MQMAVARHEPSTAAETTCRPSGRPSGALDPNIRWEFQGWFLIDSQRYVEGMVGSSPLSLSSSPSQGFSSSAELKASKIRLR
jgi:hypothetical protein